MKDYHINIFYSDEDNGYIADIPDLKHCSAFGKTAMEALSEVEIASLSAKTMAALNSFTILYNSCSLMISVLTWPLIRKNLVAGQKWAFWLLVGVIGFIEAMAFLASSTIGNGRCQV